METKNIKKFKIEFDEQIIAENRNIVEVYANNIEEAKQKILNDDFLNENYHYHSTELIHESVKKLTNKEIYALRAVDHVMEGVPESEYSQTKYNPKSIIEDLSYEIKKGHFYE